MIDHAWTVICSNSIIDRDSNIVSIQNVIEEFDIPSEPNPKGVLPIEIEIITLWVRSDFGKPSRGYARVTLLAPSGKELKTIEHNLDKLADYERLRARQRISGFPAPEPGRYTFNVELKNEGEEEWHRVASIPLKVVFTPSEIKSEGTKQD